MQDQDLFTELKNLNPLLRYFGKFEENLGICREKSRQIFIFKAQKMNNFFCFHDFLGYWTEKWPTSETMKIFKIHFLQIFWFIFVCNLTKNRVI